MFPIAAEEKGIHRIPNSIRFGNRGHDREGSWSKGPVVLWVWLWCVILRSRGACGDPVSERGDLDVVEGLPFVFWGHPFVDFGGRDSLEQEAIVGATGNQGWS